jgi:hypothetical protein
MTAVRCRAYCRGAAELLQVMKDMRGLRAVALIPDHVTK